MPQAALSIKLRYFAVLREQRGLDGETIVTQSATPVALYDELARTYGFTLPVARVGVAINDCFCAADTVLKDGDSVAFIPPVAGG